MLGGGGCWVLGGGCWASGCWAVPLERRHPGLPRGSTASPPHLPRHTPTLQVTKKVTSPLPTTDNVFYAGTGMLLCRSEEKVRWRLGRALGCRASALCCGACA